MAISKIAGQMLKDNLERDGANLAISDTVADTPVVFVDIANSRVGFNTAAPNATVDIVGNILAGNISATGNITGGNLSGTSIVGTLNTAAQPNITSVGTLTSLAVTGNITGGNLSGTSIVGTLTTAAQPNITSVGALTSVSISGNVTGGNLITAGLVSVTGNITGGNLSGTSIVGTLTTAAQTNITSVGTLVSLAVTGNANIGNLTIANTTISTTLTDGNITLSATGNAIVQITGTAGVSIPVGNTVQRPDPAVAGTLRFNTATGIVEIYTGTAWKGAGEVITSITNQTIQGDGSTATFTLDNAATAASILVTINGVNQTPAVDYTVANDVDITFTTTPIASDVIQVRFISQVTTVASVTNASGNTSVTATDSGNINFEINNSTVAQITNASILDISASHSLQLPTYTVAEATGLANVATGQVIYVSNGAAGSPCLAVYSSGWKQVAIGNAITT